MKLLRRSNQVSNLVEHLVLEFLFSKCKPAWIFFIVLTLFVLCEFFEELMLLGFLSLLLTVLQDPIAGICIPMSVAATWHPCNDDPPKTTARKLEEYSDSGFIFRRQLATKGYDKCTYKRETG